MNGFRQGYFYRSFDFLAGITLKQYSFSLAFIFIVCLLLCGCSKLPKEYPDCGIPETQMNNMISIGYISQLNTKRIGDPVYVTVIPNGNFEYVSAIDYDIRIFILDKEENLWKRVGNLSNYVDDGLSTHLAYENGFIPFFPDIEDKDGKATIYYCISGNLIQDGEISDTIIGASDLIYQLP